ncbi:MAG: hypothetical protein H0T89_35920 [Deltaproteobacteria bacterium]|nr:hypothetical protein [Deltaproteobacteria bacterium]MDQ3295556.1 hypothetical protein [Myxococcota bacterium]
MTVRGLAAAIIGSVIVHTVALAWAIRDGAPSPPLPPAIVDGRDPRPEPPTHVLEVVLLDEVRTSTGARAAVIAKPMRSGRAGTAIAAGNPKRTDEIAGTSAPGPARSPSMTMRKPGRDVAAGPSGQFLADFLARSRPLPPPPDIPGERIGDEIADVRSQLRRAGRYSPGELAALRAKIVALNEARRAEELKPAGGGRYQSDKETFRVHVHADGSVDMKDKPEKLDTQDKMMLARGIDPYARNKLAYLDRTRNQRVAIGERYRRQQLARSAELAQHHLDRLWATTTDVAARKQGAFELWDDCAEDGHTELVAGGTAARALVIGFIRSRLRGADAYTPAEIAQLDARRRSRARFAPYE